MYDFSGPGWIFRIFLPILGWKYSYSLNILVLFLINCLWLFRFWMYWGTGNLKIPDFQMSISHPGISILSELPTPSKNGEKHWTISLISKKATLHLKHTIFVHFFAVVLHGCYVKPPTLYTFYWGNVVCIPVRFFSLPLIFTLAAASICHFLSAAKNSSCFPSDEIRLLFLVSCSRSFFVNHVCVNILI